MGHGLRRRELHDTPSLEMAEPFLEVAEQRNVLDYMLDEYGNAICMDEREWTPPPIEIAPAALEPKSANYVFFPEEAPKPDPRWLVDGRFDYHANDVTPRTLRPDFPIGHGSGGGNGGGVAKPMPPKVVKARDPLREGAVLSYRVHGLTRGVKEFYHARPGEMRKTLLVFALNRLKKSHVLTAGSFPNRKADRSPVEAYGFFEEEIAFLKRDRLGALFALEEQAMRDDGERIRYRDAIFESNAA